jgi:hypothetical protein
VGVVLVVVPTVAQLVANSNSKKKRESFFIIFYFFNYYFVALELSCSKHKLYLQNNPSLRFFIRCHFLQNNPSNVFLQIVSSTFTVISPLSS